MIYKPISNSWDDLHKQDRFKPVYPLDHVVRSIFSLFSRNKDQRKKLKLLDIGSGAGRHVVFLAREGFQTYGTDISIEGIRSTQEWLKSNDLSAIVEQADMSNQPFVSDFFDGIICIGVLCYNDILGMKKTISEMHRIVKPEGTIIVITRTTDDYRFGLGEEIEKNTFIMNTDDTNENGMMMHFLEDSEIKDYFKRFDIITLEKTETTFSNGRKKNSDWIIIAKKQVAE